MKNDIFSSEIASEFGEPGGTSPPRIPRRIPRVATLYCLLFSSLLRRRND